MHRTLVLTPVLAIALCASLFASTASADGPTPTPTGSPKPTPTAGSSASNAPTASARATPSASPTDATASATPSAAPTGASSSASPTPAPSPTPTATPSANATADAAAAVQRDVVLLQSARSLAQLIDAQSRLAHDQLDALAAQSDQVAKDLEVVNGDIAALQARADARRSLHDRIERDALRLLDLPESAVPPDLPDAEREALDDLRALVNGLRDEQNRLNERTAELARLTETVGAKRAELDRMGARAQVLAAAATNGDATQRAAEVAVLQQIANEAAGAQTSLAQLIAQSMARDPGAPAAAWRLPTRGVISQTFGPTTFALEPPLVFGGLYYEHFHAALDVAAPFGTPVMAASDGVVTFVGHLSDGAEIVLIAHADGLVSEYAHLDDTFAPPPVKVGQQVKGGQVIGFIGLTGLTTGPHLHFAVMRAGLAIDPLSVLAKS